MSSKQIVRQELNVIILPKIPIPIIYKPMKYTYGLYYPDEIYIKEGLSEHQRIFTILHEIGHYMCDILSCFCWGNHNECEAHANLFALRWLLEYRAKDILKKVWYSSKPLVRNTKTYHQCKKYIKTKEMQLLLFN